MKAVEKMHVFYRDNDNDYLKETISVLGIARKMMFQNSQDALFLLCGINDQDLYKIVKKNIIGGPSIIFCRHHKMDETFYIEKKRVKASLATTVMHYTCGL